MKPISRTCVVVASLVMAGGSLACGEDATPTRPTQAANRATPSGGDAEATFAVGPDLAAVRAATAKFHDITEAYPAGYTIEFEPCVAVPGLGAMGIHARNEPLMEDQVIDPLRPELLLYAPRSNGGYRLIGVEYFVAVLLRDPVTNEVDTWKSAEPWPSTYQVVTPTPQLFGHTFDGPMPGHIPTMPWHWDMHAWIWAHNPSGMFAEWNPTVQCE